MKNDALQQIDVLKTAYDFSEYLNEYNENVCILRDFNRDRAISRLHEMIGKYATDINTFGLLNGVQVVYGIDYCQVTDYAIATQLNYINECIPIFALMRKGLDELAKSCFEKLVKSLFNGERR